MSFKQSGKILVVAIQTHRIDDEFKPDWSTETDYCQAPLLGPQSSPAEQKMEALLIQTMMSSLVRLLEREI